MKRMLPALLVVTLALAACATSNADHEGPKSESLISDLWRSPRPAAR